MTVIMVIVAFTVPRQWSMVMKRERDRQTIFIMKQYARAVREYQLRNNGVFPTYNQLRDARNPRFVRGLKAEWLDPLTGEADWLAIPAATMNTPRPGEGDMRGLGFQRGGTSQGTSSAQGPAGNLPGGGAVPATPAKDNPTPIGGVRPAKTGESFLELNGAKTYEEWSYTVNDLAQEVNIAIGAATPVGPTGTGPRRP